MDWEGCALAAPGVCATPNLPDFRRLWEKISSWSAKCGDGGHWCAAEWKTPMVGYHRIAMAIPAGTRIGHVHLKVADIERALEFYCGVLGV